MQNIFAFFYFLQNGAFCRTFIQRVLSEKQLLTHFPISNLHMYFCSNCMNSLILFIIFQISEIPLNGIKIILSSVLCPWLLEDLQTHCFAFHTQHLKIGLHIFHWFEIFWFWVFSVFAWLVFGDSSDNAVPPTRRNVLQSRSLCLWRHL